MTKPCARRLRNALRNCRPRLLAESLSPSEIGWLLEDWLVWARPDQLPPKQDFRAWLLLGGRGSGKTRAGAEWLHAKLRHAARPLRVALIGPTFAETRAVMAEGVSGLLACARADFMPRLEASRQQIVWPDGSIAQMFSAEEPDSLRGPQFHFAWADEIAKWRNPRAVWDMLQFALRLGDKPQAAVTTTPRPIPFLAELMAAKGTVISRSRTRQNAAHLAASFLEAVEETYGGTSLGRQELEGELLGEAPDALFARALLERARAAAPAGIGRIVVAVDPPASSGPRANACGIIAAGLGPDGHAYVLDDFTIAAKSPSGWAARAIGLYHARKADALIAEANQGGEMVRAVLQGIDASVPVRLVRRRAAEAALYISASTPASRHVPDVPKGKPITQSTTGMAAGISAAAGTAAAVTASVRQIADSLASPLALALCVGVILLAFGWIVLERMKKSREEGI